MPELKYCVKRDGKTYCWDRVSRRIVEIDVKPVPLANCPEDVLADILCAVEDAVRNAQAAE
jgi:hypothetical protein